MTSNNNALRKPRAAGAKASTKSKHKVGHGGVIDLHTYAVPSDQELRHMEQYMGFLVRSLDSRINTSFLETLGGEDITAARFTALSTIGACPGVRQVDIARLLNIARPAALKVVNRLVQLGLVDTHPIPSDRRIGALALTAKGQAKLQEYEAAVRAHEDRIASRLTKSQRATFDALLRKLLDL